MKILYHHRTASQDGQAVHIEEMVAALSSLGHDVLVVSPDVGKDNTLGAEAGWVQRLKRVLPKAVYELLELAYSIVAYFRLARAARDFRPDVIYERYNLFLVSGIMLKRRLSIPLLLEVNSPLAQERGQFGGLGMPWLARWVEGIIWRNADSVLPVTRVLAAHVSARGVPESHIVVIPNGINEAHFAGAPSLEEAKKSLGWSGALVLGFTGFVRDWHGVDRVIRWMTTKDAPSNARLLIVGDGPARLELEQLACNLALGDRVHFTGILPRTRVPEFVAAFDIALQPAVVPYASPLKLFEYLALGKAVVAPRQPNIEEILRDGENALLFDSTRSGALEAVLTRLCTDTELRTHIAAGAAGTISSKGLTWHANARRVTELADRSRNLPLHPSVPSGSA